MKYNFLILSALIIFLIFSTPNCNVVENETLSNSLLIVELITGRDLEGNDGSTTIFSDVLTDGGIFNDNGEVTLSARPMNPFANPSDLSFFYDVIVDQVDIRYTRAEGTGVEGRDVPYSFTQRVNVQVPISAADEVQVATVAIVLIEHNAKLESPLVELVNYGQEKVLKLEAHLTFWARDHAGNRLEPAHASVSIWCANFADPEGTDQ
jgi:hypothetical protein